jgi:predicted phosphoadenosine phosphosulfate sulfurtransferase
LYRRMEEKIVEYIKEWELRCYPDGIPDEAPIELENNNLVPSYRRICKAIMKNDIALQTLGYQRIKCDLYYQLKHRELAQKGRIRYNSGQLELFREVLQ